MQQEQARHGAQHASNRAQPGEDELGNYNIMMMDSVDEATACEDCEATVSNRDRGSLQMAGRIFA
jgi:hypothetical protein